MKIVMRVSAVVTYGDGSKGQFAGHLDERGNISLNSQVDGEVHALNTIYSNDFIEEAFALLRRGTVTDPATGTPTKVVTDLAGEISGHLAYDNGHHGGFIAQYTKKTGTFIPTGGSEDNWIAALAGNDILAKIVSLFSAIAPAIGW